MSCIGHMPFPGHRTVATVWAQQAAVPKRKHRARSRMCRARQQADAQVLRVQLEAARDFGTSLGDMTGPRGHQELARARQIAMYVARKTTTASYYDIGQCFGGRDHSTVIHACQMVEADPAALRHADELVRRLAE